MDLDLESAFLYPKVHSTRRRWERPGGDNWRDDLVQPTVHQKVVSDEKVLRQETIVVIKSALNDLRRRVCANNVYCGSCGANSIVVLSRTAAMWNRPLIRFDWWKCCCSTIFLGFFFVFAFFEQCRRYVKGFFFIYRSNMDTIFYYENSSGENCPSVATTPSRPPPNFSFYSARYKKQHSFYGPVLHHRKLFV